MIFQVIVSIVECYLLLTMSGLHRIVFHAIHLQLLGYKPKTMRFMFSLASSGKKFNLNCGCRVDAIECCLSDNTAWKRRLITSYKAVTNGFTSLSVDCSSLHLMPVIVGIRWARYVKVSPCNKSIACYDDWLHDLWVRNEKLHVEHLSSIPASSSPEIL